MNQRLMRLTQLLAIKEKATQQAANDWARARQQFLTSKQRHDQLLNYRQDYVTQLNNATNLPATTVGYLRRRIEFISQLDTALSQLNAQLSHLIKQRTHFEKLYMQKKAEQDAVVKLIEKVKLTLQLKQERAEQKESDEYAQKQWYSKNKTDN
ncbi:flagellar export protein FliJ [Legionella dresdenensis]|uniref:Flagellar FliJ protein n=1 Tax=Legionella dresdenensis TaxID=450200 RepID=A0ABV8CCI7_9GAMM